MVRDLLILVVASIAIVWSVLESAKKPLQGRSLQVEISHSLGADPDLRLISERSEYMRTER